MELKLTLNGRAVAASVEADTLLIDFLRAQGCLSVKRGCETALYWLCGRRAITSRLWRAFRRRPPTLPPLSPTRVRSSAASVTPAL